MILFIHEMDTRSLARVEKILYYVVLLREIPVLLRERSAALQSTYNSTCYMLGKKRGQISCQ